MWSRPSVIPPVSTSAVRPNACRESSRNRSIFARGTSLSCTAMPQRVNPKQLRQNQEEKRKEGRLEGVRRQSYVNVHAVSLDLQRQFGDVVLNKLLGTNRRIIVQPGLSNAADVPVHVLSEHGEPVFPIHRGCAPAAGHCQVLPNPASTRGRGDQPASTSVFERSETGLKPDVVVEPGRGVPLPAVVPLENIQLVRFLAPTSKGEGGMCQGRHNQFSNEKEEDKQGNAASGCRGEGNGWRDGRGAEGAAHPFDATSPAMSLGRKGLKLTKIRSPGRRPWPPQLRCEPWSGDGAP